MMCTMQYVDCSMYGGYDPKDPCNHTCRSDRPVRPMIVPQEMALEQLRAHNKKLWEIDVPPAMPVCIKTQIIDCRGGYDPSDPCTRECLYREVPSL